MKNKKITVSVIIVLVISIISLGVAFAAFSTGLNIGGTATVNSSKWEIVFEGLTNVNSISSTSPETVTTGSASELVHPTIKSNSTEISSYSVSLRSPGDSVTYKFKIHNKGNYAASVSNVAIASGTDLSINTNAPANTLNNIDYEFYYADTLLSVGNDSDSDCLAPDESEEVILRIVFKETDNPNVLPSSNVILNNLGIVVSYTQESSCSGSSQGGGNVSGGGGNNNNNQGVLATVGNPVTRGSNEASSESSPTISNNTITGAIVYIPNPGDEVDYPITITPSSDGGISGVSIPTTQDLIAANPNVDPDILSMMEIALIDSNGNPINSSTNRPCIYENMMQNMTLVIKNNQPQDSQMLTNMAIAIPATTLTFSNNCDPVVEYLVSTVSHGTGSDKVYTDTWGTMSELITHNNSKDPNVYVKRENGEIKNCYKKENVEYCLAYSDASNLSQYCSSISGVFEFEEGSEGYWDRCVVSNSPSIVIEYLYGVGADFNYTVPQGPFWDLFVSYGNKYSCSVGNWFGSIEGGCDYNYPDY